MASVYSLPGAICVSAQTGEGLDKLLAEIARLLRVRERPYKLFVPFKDYSLLNDLRQQGRILEEEHLEQGTLVTVMLESAALGRLNAKYGELQADVPADADA